jgi:hypothetical protein
MKNVKYIFCDKKKNTLSYKYLFYNYYLLLKNNMCVCVCVCVAFDGSNFLFHHLFKMNS